MTGIKVCGDEVSSIYGNYVPCRTFYIPITVPSNMHIWLIVFKKNIYIAVELGRLIFRRLMKRIKHTKNLFTVTFIHRLIFFPLRPDRISAGLWSIYIDEFYSSYTKSRATFQYKDDKRHTLYHEPIGLETNSIEQWSSDNFCNWKLTTLWPIHRYYWRQIGTGNREEVWAIAAQLNPPYLVLVNLSWILVYLWCFR